MDVFVKINKEWIEQVSIDNWAICQSVMLRVITVNPNPVWGAKDPDSYMVSCCVPGQYILGAAPVAQFPPPGPHTQEYCRYMGGWSDNHLD